MIRSSPARYGFARAKLGLDATLVAVAERCRQGVGGIRCRRPIEFQNRNHHVLNLFLGRGAGANDRLLYRAWRVLKNLDTVFERRAERRRACMT